MADLLKLVDQLIGSILKGNLYTDVSPFIDANLQRPDNADKHVPNVDPRLLNIEKGTEHPHADSKVIPPPPHSPPPLDRSGMYQQGGPIPSSVLEQFEKSSAVVSPTPELTPKNIPVGGTPMPQADRDKIYESSDHLSRTGNPIADLMDFHKSIETSEDFAKARSFANRQQFYSDVRHDGGSESQIKSNIGGGPPGPEDQSTSRLTLGDVSLPPPNPAIQKDIKPIEGRIRAAEDKAHRMGNIFHDNNTFGVFPGEVSMLKYFDVVAATQWLDTVGQEVLFLSSRQNDPITGEGKVERTTETFVKSTTWLASQFLLTAMNPTDAAGYGELNAIWNPLSLPISAIPLLRSTPAANITAGAALGGLMDVVGLGGGPYSKNVLDEALKDAGSVSNHERLLRIRRGAYRKSVDGTMIAQLKRPDEGFFGDLASSAPGGGSTLERSFGSLVAQALVDIGLVPKPTLSEGMYSIPEQVDGLTERPIGKVHTNLYTPEKRYEADGKNALHPLRSLEADILEQKDSKASEAQRIHISKRFVVKGFPGAAGPIVATGIPILSAPTFYAKKHEASTDFDNYPSVGINAATTDVGFPKEDETGLLKELIDEGQIYLPLMFQDLRDPEDGNRFLYFRAFLKPGIAETFSPDWQTSRYYGRVDQIPVYQGTVRSLNFAFDVIAWGPHDLSIMWLKIQKLQSMVYPTYTTGGFMEAGPIIRLRIGDLIAGGANRGLPGYITSMDLAYDDGIWNIRVNEKVPRKVSISIGFTVLHEGNPGIYPFEKSDKINLNEEDTPSKNKNKRTFSVATFTDNKDDKTTTVKLSTEEIRKIFSSIKTSRGITD